MDAQPISQDGVTRHLLLIDPSPNLAQRVLTALDYLDEPWQIHPAADPHAIDGLMTSQAMDVVLCGVEPMSAALGLLALVQRRHPAALRIVIAKDADYRAARESSKVAHQCIRRTVDPAALAYEIGRVIALQRRIGTPEVLRFAGGLRRIPTMPSIYQQLRAIVSRPDFSLAQVTRTISQDAGIAARVLRLVNSAYFGLRSRVSTLDRAVSLLGAKTVSSLVFGLTVSDQFNTTGPAGQIVRSEWNRSLAVAMGAGSIARAATRDTEAADAAYLAGLFHNVGRMVLADNLGARYAGVSWPVRRADIVASERKLFSLGHPEVGALLLANWALSDDLVDAVAFSLDPSSTVAGGFAPLAAVHVAAAFNDDAPVDMEFLDRAGCSEHLGDWRRIWSEAVEVRLAG